jgi:hypothetical protein
LVSSSVATVLATIAIVPTIKAAATTPAITPANPLLASALITLATEFTVVDAVSTAVLPAFLILS